MPVSAADPRPLVLLLCRAFGTVREVLERDFRVVVLPELADGESFLAHEGGAVRALVSVGRIPIAPALLDRLPGLRVISFLGAGHEGVDVTDAHARGLALSYCPATNHEDVADLALGLAISLVRGVVAGDAVVRSGGWDRPAPLPLGPSMRELRFGIVGLGAIGGAVAERFDLLGCPVKWWGPRPKPDARWARAESLEHLAQWSEVLVLAAPATQGMRPLIGAPILAALGRGYLINVARGALIEEAALIASLRSGALQGAALDVFAQEPTDWAKWADVPNIILTPHLGGWARASIRASEELVAKNIRRCLDGQPVLTPIP